MKQKAHKILHEIEFTEQQWEDIICLTFEPFEIESGESLTRGQWTAIAHMAIGKATLIDAGRYDMGDDLDEALDNVNWSNELRAIADKILEKFKPGDGNL